MARAFHAAAAELSRFAAAHGDCDLSQSGRGFHAPRSHAPFARPASPFALRRGGARRQRGSAPAPGGAAKQRRPKAQTAHSVNEGRLGSLGLARREPGAGCDHCWTDEPSESRIEQAEHTRKRSQPEPSWQKVQPGGSPEPHTSAARRTRAVSRLRALSNWANSASKCILLLLEVVELLRPASQQGLTWPRPPSTPPRALCCLKPIFPRLRLCRRPQLRRNVLRLGSGQLFESMSGEAQISWSPSAQNSLGFPGQDAVEVLQETPLTAAVAGSDMQALVSCMLLWQSWRHGLEQIVRQVATDLGRQEEPSLLSAAARPQRVVLSAGIFLRQPSAQFTVETQADPPPGSGRGKRLASSSELGRVTREHDVVPKALNLQSLCRRCRLRFLLQGHGAVPASCGTCPVFILDVHQVCPSCAPSRQSTWPGCRSDPGTANFRRCKLPFLRLLAGKAGSERSGIAAG